MPKAIKRLLLFLTGVVIILVIGYNLWLKQYYEVPILMYHRIGTGDNESLFVKTDTLNRQIGYLKYRRYNVISLDELVEGIKQGRKFKRNTVVITFDDGYEDIYLNAYDIIRTNNLPVTVFLISNYIDKGQDFLKWQQIEKMLKDSRINFGAHTRHHAYLPDISAAGGSAFGEKDKNKLKDEIKGSKKDIEAHLNSNVDYFCYPVGGFSQEIKQIVKESGYKGACTTNRGFNKSNNDIYALRRIKVKDSDFVKNPISFWFKLSGYYNLFRNPKNPY